jgi:excisionase family DNA binding protein
VSLESTLAELFDAKLAPLIAENRRLASEIAQLRRSLPRQLVGVTRAAELLKLDRRTVLRQIEAGEIPATRVGKKWLVDLAALHRPDPSEVARVAGSLQQIPDHK